MYRRKKSAKLDRILDSLKNARFSRRLSTLVTLLSSLQSSNDLIASISFFLSCSFHYRFIWAFQAHFIEHFKLISSDVSSLFLLDIEHFKLSSWHRAFQAYFIRRFKPISSCQMSLKQTHFKCRSSKLTIKWRAQLMRSIVVFWFVSATRI